MAKLYFYYSAMNAGKTTNLLQSAHNYRERGMRVLILAPQLDSRAGSGTVAAITRDTEGVPIVVVRHEGQLMTVYSGLGALNVAKGDKVSAGGSLGQSGKSGVVHFEVRQGFDSVDPESYLR